MTGVISDVSLAFIRIDNRIVIITVNVEESKPGV